MPCWWGLTRPKKLSILATAWVIWLCACVRYWANRGLFECGTAFIAVVAKKCWPPRSGNLWTAWIRIFRHLESTQNSQKFELTFQFPRLGTVYTCPGKFLLRQILFLDCLFTWIHGYGFFLLLCCYWSSLMWVVYHLPRNSGNFGWDVNGKAVWFARTEFFFKINGTSWKVVQNSQAEYLNGNMRLPFATQNQFQAICQFVSPSRGMRQHGCCWEFCFPVCKLRILEQELRRWFCSFESAIWTQRLHKTAPEPHKNQQFSSHLFSWNYSSWY